jgi:gamma-glutamyltranspeptidase/glutathione hydrolase
LSDVLNDGENAMTDGRISRRRIAAPALVLLCSFCLSVLAASLSGQTMAVNGMVVTSHPMAAQAGLRILQEGGNAFDAAVASAAVLAVVEPLMSGLGGVGGYALLYDSKKEQVRSLDFIGAAPAAATAEMFTVGSRLWDRAHPARDSFVAPLVPGNLAGWSAILEEHGTMSWAQVLAPAIEYSEKGFAVTPAVNEPFGSGGFGGAVGRYPYGASIFFKGDKPWPVAEVLQQPDMAKTLRAIAAGGPEVFYGGALAEKFASFSQKNGGILTVKDFADYKARWAEPLRTTYRGYTVYSQPPGGSGMTVLQTLNTLEQFDIPALEHNSPEFIHLVAEALKLAFVDDDRYNTGKDYAKIPLDRLLSKEYAKEQAARIDRARAQTYPVAGRQPMTTTSQHTTHHTVADKDHNVVTITQTLMLPAGMAVPETGVIFNNGMSYFSLDPTDVNHIEGGQRPRFVMSPTIVMRQDGPYLALGSAGGWTIPQTILQVVVRALDFDMDAHEAVKAPRFTVNYLGNSIPYPPGTDLVLEREFPESTRTSLAELGHRLTEPAKRLGMLNAIKIYPRSGALSGGADPRREGHAAAW